MNAKFNLTIALLVVSTMLASAVGDEFTKQISKGWTRSSVTELKVSNKFGEVKINDLGGDSVTIKVVIKIDNASERKADDLMNKIQINIQKTGSMVSAETNIREDFRNNEKFTIDYLINIPKDRDLNITNKYGNVTINELDAKGFFEVNYGSLTAGNIKAPSGSPVKIQISYGQANLESINDADMELKYSKLVADEINHLVLDSRYSAITLHKTSKLTLESNYDGINIEEVDNLKSVSKYTNYKIGLLTGSFDLDTGYGSVRISKVGSKFENIKIINSYGGINIGLNNLNYNLKVDCNYCDVKYPKDRFKGNKINDNQRFSLEGNVGSGGGTVSITSRYGGVKLTDE